MKPIVCLIFAVIFIAMSGMCMVSMLTGAPPPTLSWSALALLYYLVADQWIRFAEKGPRP